MLYALKPRLTHFTFPLSVYIALSLCSLPGDEDGGKLNKDDYVGVDDDDDNNNYYHY